MDKQLIARLKAIESRHGAGQRLGLAYARTLIGVEGDGNYQESDVIALDVGIFGAQPTRVIRKAGESLEALEARANPQGCWRAAPMPVFRGGEGCYVERAEILWLTLNSTNGRGL